MSLLLDALRKSESRRRLGQPPGLELPGIPVSDRRRRPLWLALPLVALAVAAAAWWWWPQATTDDAPAVVMEDRESSSQRSGPVSGGDSETEVQPPRPVPQEQSSGPAPGEGRAEPETPATVPESDPREATADADEPVAGRAESESGSRPAGESPSPPEADKRAGWAERGESGDETAEAGSGSESESGAEPDTGAGVEQVPEPEPESESEGDAGDDRDRVDRGTVAEYLQVWELPRNIREDLPSLDLSINVYSQRPESRFALINGERFQEGDEVASGVVIHRITRDGAVLDYRDYRFLLE